MAAVARVRSALNPNAPAFIPAALRLVEDFSPEWWNLVQTSPWYRDYWLSERQETFDADRDENEEDVLDLLPESIDLEFDNEFGEFEVRFQELAAESEALEKKERKEVKMEANGLLSSLSLPKSPKEGRSPRSFTPKFDGGKTPKFVGPQPRALRRIQQPR